MLIYDVAFSAETDGLKKQLAELKDEVKKALSFDDPTFGKGMFRPLITEGKAAADFLQQALQKATSVDGVSLSRFNAELRKSGVSADELAKRLADAGMTKNLNTLVTTITSADTKLTVFNDHIKEMHRVLSQSIKFRAAMAVQDFLVGQAQAAVQWTKDFNQGLIDIQVVSEKTGQQMEKVFDAVIKKSKELNTTAKEYSQAALVYYQQGLADEEVIRRTDITIKAARAAGEDAEAMSQNLTAIWNTYQMTGDRLQNAASIAARLGADTAVDFAYIAEAMQTSALGAAQMGLAYENLAAIIATVGETTMQTASVVGNAYKTILTRFEQLKTTGSDGEITLGRISQQLQDLGIHILDASGELKSMDTIIYETGESWQTYSQKQQIAVAQVLGGVRQFPQVLALFNNWDKFLNNASTAFGETGADTLEKQFLIASDSIAVAADQAAEAWQRAFGEIANDDVLKMFYDGLKSIGITVDVLIKSFGGLPGILTIVGAAFTQNILTKAQQGISSMTSFISTAMEASRTGLSSGVINQQRAGASIMKNQDPNSADYRNTERRIDTATLKYQEQLNNTIRTGTEFEKERATTEKTRYDTLLKNIYNADVALEKLNQKGREAEGNRRGSFEDQNLGQIVAKITPQISEEDKQSIINELQTSLVGYPIDLDLQIDETFEQYLQRISTELIQLKADAPEMVSAAEKALNVASQAAAKAADAFEKTKQDIAEAKVEVEDLEFQLLEADEAMDELLNADSSSENSDAIEELEQKIKDLNKELILTKGGIEDMEDSLKDNAKTMTTTEKAANKAERNLKNVSAAAESVGNASDGMVSTLGEAGSSLQDIAGYANTANNILHEVGAFEPPKVDFTQALGGLTQTAAGINLVTSSMTNLVSSIIEGDLTFSGFMSSIIGILGSLPLLSNGLKMITGFITSLQLAKNADAIATTKQTIATELNTAGNNKNLASQVMLTAAKKLGVDITNVSTIGELKAAMAAKGVTVAKLAETVAVNINTAAWYANPIFWIAAVIVAVIAVFLILNSVLKAQAAAARDAAEKMNENLAAIENSTSAINSSTEALEDNIEALSKTTKGTEEYSKSLKATEDSLESVRAEINKLQIDGLTTQVLEQAEALGLATGEWAAYREELSRVQEQIEAERLAQAQRVADTNLYSAQKNMNETRHIGDVDAWFSGEAEMRARLAAYEAMAASSAMTNVTKAGGKYSLDIGGNLNINTSSAADFAASYREAERLLAELDKIGAAENIQLDVNRELREELEKVREEYEAIVGVLDDLDVVDAQSLQENGSIADPETIKTIKDYKNAVSELADIYSETMDYDDAKAKAEAYYSYLASQNTSLGGQLKELQVAYNAVEAAKERGRAHGIRSNKMEAAFSGLTDEEQTYFARVDLRGYDRNVDLETYIRDEIAKIKTQDIVIQARLDLEQTRNALETFKSDGPAGMLDALEWGKNGIVEYIDFLRMTAEEQEAFLLGLVESQMQAQNQGLEASKGDIQQTIAETTANLEAARAKLEELMSPIENRTPWDVIYDPIIRMNIERDRKDTTQDIAQFEAYLADLQAKADANEISIKLAALEDAMLSQSVDDLLSKMQQGRIEAEQFEQALDGVFMSEAEGYGFDGEEMLAFANHIQEVAVESDLLSDHLATNKKDAMEAAIAIARLNRGIDSLAGGFDDWNDVLTKSDKASQEYFEALQGMRKAMADVLNIDASDMSSKFIEDNLEAIEKASKGSTEALAELQLAAGEDIVLQFTATLDDEALVTEVLGSLTAIQEYINGIDLSIRADLDPATINDLGTLGQAFIDTATNAGMAAEDIAASLQAMGYNARVVTSYEEQEISVPVYTEYSTMSTQSAPEYDENGTMTSPPTWQRDTYTVHSDNKTMTGMVPVTSVEIDGMNGSFGGDISNYSTVNAGGPPPKKSSGGGGGSKPKPQENLKSTNNDSRLGYLNNLLDLYGKIEFYGKKEVARLEREAELQKEIVTAVQTRADMAIQTRDEAMEGMIEYGAIFSVDENGLSYLTNLEEIVDKHGDTNEKLGEALKTYTEAESKLVESRLELADQQQTYLDKMLSAALSINKQTLTFQERAIKIAESWQSSYIRGARILTDAGGNLYGEMSRLSEEMYAGAARLLNMYFEKDAAMLNNFHNNVTQYDAMWQKIQENNRLAESMGWEYAVDGNMSDRATLLEEMHAVQDGLMATLEDLYAHNEKVWNTFQQILDEWTDHLDVIYGKFDNMKSVVESMLDIARMTGTQMFTPEQRKTLLSIQKTQQTINKEQVAAAKQRMDAEQQNLDRQKAAVEDFIANRDRTYGGISDDEFARQLQSMNKMTRSMEENLQSATDEYWSAFKGSIEDAWDYYETYGEEIIYKMKHNLATGAGFAGSAAEGSWSFLGQMLGFRNEELDRYMNPGGQIRQSTELMRQLKEFDTDQILDMDEYNDLMADILAAKNMEVELTEYDYQILVERFNLIKAQAAFEDARAAKNTMRLARDASGNWSYIYSSDQEKTDDKAKDIEDSLNKIYELSYDRIRDLVNELYGLPDALASALGELDPNDPKYEEQAFKIKEYYTERANYLLNQINAAEMNSANVLNLVVKSKITDLEYLQSIQNLGKITVEDLYGTELGWLIDSEAGNQHLRDVIEETVGDQIENWKDLQQTIHDSFDAAGQDINTFVTEWDKNAKAIGEDAATVGAQFTEAQIAASAAIKTMIEQQQAWAEDMVIQASSIVDSIRSIISEIEKLEGKKLGFEVDPSTGNMYRNMDFAAEIGRMIEQANLNPQLYGGGWNAGEDSAKALAAIKNSTAFQALVRERDMKIKDQGLAGQVPSTDELLNLIARGAIGWDNSMNSWVYWSGADRKRTAISFDDLMRMITDGYRPQGFTAYSTGGLVPSPNSLPSSQGGDTVPAMLTPAEYVLNPDDTREFFKAFQQFLALPNFSGDIMEAFARDALQQLVQIQADFPNVSSRDEIQAALNNLINQAKQYNV